jgi:hypothetical protein
VSSNNGSNLPAVLAKKTLSDLTDSQFTQQGQGEDQTLPNDFSLSKIRKGDLESNGCTEKDAHQPLQDTLELTDKQVMQRMRGTKGQPGNKGTHQIRSLAIICRRHENDKKADHDTHFHFAVGFFLEPCQNVLVDQIGQNKNCQISTNDQITKSTDDGDHDRGDFNFSHQRFQLRKDYQGNHIINDGRRNNQLTDRPEKNQFKKSNKR